MQKKNAILLILTLVLFYRLIVAIHIGLVFLIGLLQLTAKKNNVKSVKVYFSANAEI